MNNNERKDVLHQMRKTANNNFDEGFEKGRTQTLEKVKKDINELIAFKDIWLKDKDFKGRQRDFLQAYQDELKELISKLEDDEVGGEGK